MSSLYLCPKNKLDRKKNLPCPSLQNFNRMTLEKDNLVRSQILLVEVKK